MWDEELDRPVNGRCRVHGGLSTGPRTEEGLEAIRESNRRRRTADKGGCNYHDAHNA